MDPYQAWKQKFDNPYEAVHAVVQKSRRLSEQVNYNIRPSQALRWAVTDEPPECVTNKSVYIRRPTYADEVLANALAQIDDNYIRKSVELSFNKSHRRSNLYYVYHESLTEHDKARVRVIMNMLWAEYQKEE